MGILKSAADLVYTIRFLKLLVTPFEKMGAYEAGIIDKDGNRNKDFSLRIMDNRFKYAAHYTSFIRLVINLKKLMAKVPGGKSIIARYGAALLLIKENGNLSDKQVNMIHEETGIDILDCLVEQTQWYMLELRIEKEHWVALKPFLIFLKAIKNDMYTNIHMDKSVVMKLREI